jgi:hypothetical protein
MRGFLSVYWFYHSSCVGRAFIFRGMKTCAGSPGAAPCVLARPHPQLPWRAIMGVGNVYRHDYDNVAEEFVWRTVNQSLGPLLAVVESEIERLPQRAK